MVLDFTKNIKIERKRLNLTQKELASKLNTTHASINRYELGLTEPNLAKLVAMAKIFNVTTDYLLGIEPVETKEVAPEFNQEQLQVVELIKKLNSKELEKVYNYLLGIIDARD